jgi:predicted protein tyrosine phosphatase
MIVFTSRKNFETTRPKDSVVVISIISSFLSRQCIAPPSLEGWHPDSIQLFFDDCCPDDATAKETLMDAHQADLIAALVEKHNNKVDWIVHCEAGICRSAAVARFIGEETDDWLKGEGMANDTNNANPHVLMMLHRTGWSKHFEES